MVAFLESYNVKQILINFTGYTYLYDSIKLPTVGTVGLIFVRKHVLFWIATTFDVAQVLLKVNLDLLRLRSLHDIYFHFLMRKVLFRIRPPKFKTIKATTNIITARADDGCVFEVLDVD